MPATLSLLFIFFISLSVTYDGGSSGLCDGTPPVSVTVGTSGSLDGGVCDRETVRKRRSEWTTLRRYH